MRADVTAPYLNVDPAGERFLIRGAHRLQRPMASFMLALLAYLVTLALLLPRGVNPLSAAHFLGIGADPTLFAWALSWWPYALTHGLNPFVTHTVWAPQGFNLAWDTSVPSVALLIWPVTGAAGPVVAYNVAIMASPVLAALAAFGLCRELTGRTWPAVVGGWLFGYGPYETGQLLGHLHLTFIFPVPLLMWLAVRRWRGAMGGYTYAGLSALALALLLGVSVEVYLTFTLMAALLALLTWMLVPDQRGHLYSLLRWGSSAYAGSLVLTLPFLYYLIIGMGAAPGSLHSPVVYSADVLNFVFPTPITTLGSAASLPVTSRFTGNLAENGAFVGLPLLGLLTWWVWRSRRDRWTRVLALAALACLVAELGPKLHVGGLVGGHLPWILLSKLPLLKQILPVRLAMYFDLMAAVTAAIILARLSRGRALAASLIAAIMVLSWWPASWPATKVVTPPLLRPQNIRQEFRAHETLVVLPYGAAGQSMIWQATDQMYFNMAGGYLSFVPKSLAKLRLVRELYGTLAPGKHFGASLLAFCHSHGVVAVVATRGTPPPLMTDLSTLSWRTSIEKGAVVYWVPSAGS